MAQWVYPQGSLPMKYPSVVLVNLPIPIAMGKGRLSLIIADVVLQWKFWLFAYDQPDSEGKASARKATAGGSRLASQHPVHANDLEFESNGGLDYGDSSQDVIGLPPPDEDDEDELKDAPLVYSKYFQLFIHLHAHQAWQAQMLILVDRYLAWKHNGLEDMAGNHVFHVDVISVFRNLQAMMKVLCALQNALGCDGPAWKLCGACPACAFKVEMFKDDVWGRPGKTSGEKRAITCTDNWTAAKSVQENQIQVFEQTECIAEMKQSGELVEYGLAAVNWLLNNHTLYQLGFGNEDLETCERIFSSSNNMALLICHASEFHWKQFLDLHFSQWDSDKYLELSIFLYNNYKQVLHIIQTNLAELEQFKHGESDATSIAVEYVELLKKLSFAEATYGSVTQVPYLTYTPAKFTSTSGLNESTWQGMNAINAKYASTLQKYQLQLNIVANFECQHNITDCWTPLHPEYINACEYTKHRTFIHVVEELEGLVVQRMFGLLKANLAKMGYKMHKHISKAISRHSTAICTALEHYNRLAPHQHLPHPRLDYADVIGYSLLGEFSLLKHSHYEVLEKLWALPDNHEMMTKYYKLW
ncbi:hypothetical protein EDC04DRAFT_2612450 [Pisolithus marmoratus]|nr:hypothetical protein EDC04DRAFT_2612450 [Pisolithus marmoratus]